MVGEGSVEAISRSKLNLDFDTLLPCDGADDDQLLPEIQVVDSSLASAGFNDRCAGEQSHSAGVFDDVMQLTNQKLEDKIKRLRRLIQPSFANKLCDKGAKLNAELKAYEEEKERRRRNGLLEDGMGSWKPSQPETLMRNSQSNEPKQAARLSEPFQQSQFATSPVQKMNKGVSRICDAFGPELVDDKTKKRQKTRPAGRETSKSSLPPTRKDNSYSDSAEVVIFRRKSTADITSRCRSEPRGNRLSLRSSNANAKQPVVLLLDEDEAEPEEECDDSALRETSIFYPSRDDPRSVEIRYEELKCLSPSMYLTSTIMNFYIRCLQESLSSKNPDQTDYQFFNTYFYKKLQDAVSCKSEERESIFIKFRRWWKGVNIFQKAYIFLPIHQDVHWSLVIICFPHEADESGPVILHLDSLGYHYSSKIFSDIKRFLKEEWNCLKEETGPPAVPIRDEIWQHLPSHIEEKIIRVPQQKNDSDCGVFVLYFIEHFIKEAPQRLRKQNLAMFGRKWFKPEEASKLRGKIKRLLKAKFLNAAGKFEPLAQQPNSPGSEVELELIS